MAHPDDQDQAHICDAEHREYLKRIFYRQVPLPIEPDQEEGRDSQNFPTDEERLEITGENNGVVADVKEQDGVEKPLVAPFAMKVPPGVDGNQKAEEGTDEQINRGNFVEIE